MSVIYLKVTNETFLKLWFFGFKKKKLSLGQILGSSNSCSYLILKLLAGT